MNYFSALKLFCVLAVSFFVTSLHSQQQEKLWLMKNNFQAGIMEKAAAFTINDKGYAGLGTDNSDFRNDFWKYDPGKDTWEQVEKFPAEARISSVAFSIGNKGYVGTGLISSQGMQQSTKDFWEYDEQKNTWTQKANLPGESRYGALGFSIDGKGYISLGTDKKSYYTDLWEFNPASNKWSKKTDFPGSGRVDASVFVSSGEAYILLGQKKELTPSLKDCWKYNPVKNEWKKVSDFPSTARTGALAFAYNNMGYIACGFNGKLKRYQDFWEYDAANDKWFQKQDVPFGSRDYIFAFTIGNYAYICTGYGQKNAPGFEVWKYDFNYEKNRKDKFALGGTLLLGENRIPLAATDVKILDNKGEVIRAVSTGLFGSFLFMELSLSAQYTISAVIQDSHWRKQKIYLVNRENETVAVLDADNDFKFHITQEEKNKLKLLKIENKNMRMDMRGKFALSGEKKVPFANADISLINDQQEIVQVTTTDQNGIFIFNYLPVDTNLYLTIDEKATSALPKGTTILLMDEKENIVNKSTAANAEFLLVSLPPQQNKLSKIFMEDPWLQATFGTITGGLMVTENVYFDYGKSDLVPEAKAVLNKVVISMNNNKNISLEITAHTDSRGDEKSNLSLSEKRAQEAKKYILSQGIDSKRITAKGLGESRLLNRCTDDIPCTEEEHAQNRRMEFTIRK